MTYQKADYPLDYSTSAKAPAKDRLREWSKAPTIGLGQLPKKPRK